MIKVSETLIGMLNRLPKTDQKVFAVATQRTMESNFQKQRKTIAHKLNNPRLLQIHFHTFRHWKATMEYHKTKDILHVMNLLGHRAIQNTLIYTQLVTFEGNEWHSSTAKTVEEAKQLIESGFEYVTTLDGTMLFRKRK